MKKKALRTILAVFLFTGIFSITCVPALAADYTHTFPAAEIGYTQPSHDVTFTYTNANNHTFTAAFTGRDAYAFTASPTSRTLNGNGTLSVTVRPISGLPPGAYFATLVCNIPSAPTPTFYIDFYFTVLDKFEVTFVDWNDEVLKTQTVTQGYNATAPASPTRIGYSFTGWDRSFSNITRNLTVRALYSINYYNVTFLDWDDRVIDVQSIAYESGALAPTDPTRTGYTFVGWDEDFSSITDDLTVTALYDPILVNVTPSAYVVKLNGNQNELTVIVTEQYFDGSIKTVSNTFKIDNNAASAYGVGPYKVYVNTKGNVQIRECYILL